MVFYNFKQIILNKSIKGDQFRQSIYGGEPRLSPLAERLAAKMQINSVPGAGKLIYFFFYFNLKQAFSILFIFYLFNNCRLPRSSFS